MMRVWHCCQATMPNLKRPNQFIGSAIPKGVFYMKKMCKYLELFRPLDVVVIIILILASFIPVAVFAVNQYSSSSEVATAIVTINGEEVDRFVLSKQTPRQLVTYTSEDGLIGNQYNIIEVYKTQIRVKEDNSPDQIAVMTGWISRPGQTSICLPHRLVIRIERNLSEEIDDDYIIVPF